MLVKLKELCSIRRGSSPRPIQDFLSSNGMPWVKISDATRSSSRFINLTEQYIKHSGVKNSVVVNPGDLILSNSATPGLPKLMGITACIHDGWLLLDNLDNRINKMYLYYNLLTIQKQLNQKANGSVFLNLKTDIVKDFEIELPSMEKQLHIVNILGTIDDKIENNEKMIDTINKLSKQYYISFCDNGYSEAILENYIDNYDKQRKPLSSRERDSLEKIYPYYGATEVLDYVDNYLFEGDYLLMGEDGTVADSSGFPIIQRVNEKFWANNHTHILRAKNGIDNNILELILKNTNVQSIITGAVQPKINQANMNSLKIKIPDNVDKLQQLIAPIFNKRHLLLIENKNLSDLKQLYLKKFFG